MNESYCIITDHFFIWEQTKIYHISFCLLCSNRVGASGGGLVALRYVGVDEWIVSMIETMYEDASSAPGLGFQPTNIHYHVGGFV